MTISLLIAVVADELEERAAQIAREEGAMGLTMLPGRGLSFPEHATFFGLSYLGIEKVMVCVLDSQTAETIANRLNHELDLLTPFNGLAFCIDVDQAGGIDPDAIRQHVLAHSPRYKHDDEEGARS